MTLFMHKVSEELLDFTVVAFDTLRNPDVTIVDPFCN